MALPWDRFADLEGDPKHNLELLIRALVQRNYGRFGQMRSRRQQPGVEFHLKLHTDCDLGEAGRWFGWQCRWYDLPKDRSLGKTRRKGITDAITKAKADIEGLTDFVLCLRELPRKADVDWYFGLDMGVRLHLWADEEIETRLTGDAEVLRHTYFGELILTAAQLEETHQRAIEPIKRRWIPVLHVTTSVQDAVEVALVRAGSATSLQDHAAILDRLVDDLRSGREQISGEDRQAQSDAVAGELASLSERLTAIADASDTQHPGDARALLVNAANPGIRVAEVRHLARQLRAQHVPCALAASAAEADIRHGLGLLAARRKLVTAPIVAIVGDAGRGKTQLAAQLTASFGDAPAGIFLKGADLRAGGSLDELAARVPGINAETFDALLEATDAAGARGGVRIPIVIDGLNDAERPAEWQGQLAAVKPILERYEHVLLIVTLRGAVRGDVLPDETVELELEWQETEIDEAVARYFEHYLIDPGSARLPMGLFSNPLFLRMFCEAVNPDRTESVGVEALPTSLVAVFELYRERTTERLRTRAGRPALAPGHIENRLAALALEMWERGTRELPFAEARQIIDGDEDDWDKSLIRALEEEGVLFRDDHGWADQRTAVLFDRLAGYLIADAITAGLAINRLDEELSSTDLWNKLRGGADIRHPVAEDVLVALVGLLPRRFFGRQLWRFAPGDRRDWALAQTLDLESRFLDMETVDALGELVSHCDPPQRRWRHPFDRLWEVRDGVEHQLNARFLDRVLRSMTVAARDLRWSEWVRANADELGRDLDELEAQWVATGARDEHDDLNARAVAWLLTSSSLPLRDRATRALQRYGRADPGRLFSLTTDLLGVDDPYVIERLLAASFGAATAHQMPDPGGPFERALGTWLEELARRFLAADAAAPTSHQMARQYISGCFELATSLHPAALPDGINVDALDFGAGPEPDPIPADDERSEECNETFGMDFENYIIGSIYEDRANYEMDHVGYLDGIADVRGRVWELGWRSAEFSDLDKRIGEDQWRRHESPDRVERYGKKYGWIAFYELAGRLDDRGELRQRGWLSDRGVWPDIDPTFPADPGPLQISMPAWAAGGPEDDRSWYCEAPIEAPDELLAPDTIDGEPGPWLAVEGFLQHRDPLRGRRVWGFIRGVLVDAAAADELARELSKREYLGNDFVPRCPSDISTFAGEMPWSARYAAHGDMENGLAPYHAVVSERWGQPGTEVELLGHEYSLDADRTITNVARGHCVPSHNFAAAFGLRQRPGTLDFVGLDGRAATMSRDAPDGFEGKLLYLRRDLVAEYAAGRRLVRLAWGERQVDVDWGRPPDWLEELRSGHADLWRRVEVVDP